MNKQTILIVVFSLFFTLVMGQENPWPLTKCIDLALQNNIEIKIQQLEIKRTQRAQNSVLNRMLPSITIYGEQGYNFGSTIDPATNGRVSSNIQKDNFYGNARANLIDFSAFANAKKDKINIELAKAEKEVVENEYKLQLLESYYQALYAQELLKIQKEQLQQAVFNVDRITKEVNIGNKPQSDLYDMQLSYAEDEKQYLETQQLYEIKKTELFQLMNVSTTVVEQITLEPYLGYELKNELADEKTLIENPKLKKATLNYQNSKITIQVERANNLPLVSAYYGYSTFYFKNINMPSDVSFKNQFIDNKSQEVVMQLVIPVFNGFRNNKKISAAKIESEKYKLAIEKQKQELDKQIELEEKNKQNYAQLQHKLEERQTYAKASLGTTLAKFTNGKIEAILYATVKNQYLAAEYDVLKNQLQLQYVNLKINLLANNTL